MLDEFQAALRDNELPELNARSLATWSVPPDRLTIEVTESAIIRGRRAAACCGPDDEPSARADERPGRSHRRDRGALTGRATFARMSPDG